MTSLDILTRKEREILLLVMEGRPYKQTCCELYISENTLKKHIKNIYKKIQVNSRSEAVMWLLQRLFPEQMNTATIKSRLMDTDMMHAA